MNAEPKLSLQSSINPDVELTPRRTKVLRRVLMGIIPVVAVVAAGTWYMSGGRYVSTDNAYLKAGIASVSPEVSGNILAVLVSENQVVTQGQPLLSIDDTNYRIALSVAESELRTATASIDSDKARYRQKEASLAIMQGNVAFAEREFKRQSTLASSNFVAVSKLDEAKHALDSARQNIALVKQEEAEILARLDGDPNIAPEKVPSYQQALAHKAAASTAIQRATVTAPFAGVVSQLPKSGDYARSGAPILSVVSTTNMWIDANYKETELTNMKVGQPVEIDVDTYPNHPFHGHITSISQASGAVFSLLPAQNSTGNWIKVVQRIPVRVSVDDEHARPTLRAGMSVVTSVDTGRTRLQEFFSSSAR